MLNKSIKNIDQDQKLCQKRGIIFDTVPKYEKPLFGRKIEEAVKKHRF